MMTAVTMADHPQCKHCEAQVPQPTDLKGDVGQDISIISARVEQCPPVPRRNGVLHESKVDVGWDISVARAKVEQYPQQINDRGGFSRKVETPSRIVATQGSENQLLPIEGV